MQVRLAELAERFGLTLVGEDRVISGVASLEQAGPDDLSFLSNAKYADQLKTTKAGAVIVQEKYAQDVSCALVSAHPYLSLAYIAALFAPRQGSCEGVSELAFIHPDATIEDGAEIHPFVFVGAKAIVSKGARLFPHVHVGERCVVGEGTTLYPNVSLLADVRIGRNVTIHSGTVLGSDGFGYAQSPQGHVKVPQIGGVEVADEVEIGANCCVDRGSFSTTRIGYGVKIDNLCQIAHNVQIGDFSLVVAQVGISGSTKLGKGVVLAGQVGVADHIEIGDGTMVGAQSGVGKDLPPGSRASGSPVMEHGTFLRNSLLLPKLPEMAKKMKQLEKKIALLEEKLGAGE